MHILLGPMKAENEASIRHPEFRLGDSFCFYDQDSGSYQEILAKLPNGWKPDVVIHWSLEYYAPPKGFETAECLTAAILGDWNLGGQAMQLMGGAFDILIADKNGCERLTEAGFKNVIYAPLWNYDPAIHRILPGIERDIDILMIGSFNHEIQRERARWIARVLRLSNRFNVCITAGFFGEDYTRMMNRAKIVFNRSIRGEMNMRAYEAGACGALLFYERENREVRDFFKDKKECVLYGDNDLEELLEYYLSHPGEAETIAKAGNTAVQPYTMQHQTNHIYDLLEAEISTSRIVPQQRLLLTLPPSEREYHRLCHQLLLPVRHPYQIADQLAVLDGQKADHAALLNARGCALSGLCGDDIEDSIRTIFIEQATACFTQCISIRPDYAIAWFNLAQLALKTNLPIAPHALEQTCQLLSNGTMEANQLIGPYYPGVWDALRTELERVFGWFKPESSTWRSEICHLLLWLTYEQCSDFSAKREHWEAALEYAQKAVAIRPDVFSSRLRLARALRNLGQLESASVEYRLSLDDLPLNPEVWEELAENLLELKQYDECHTLLEECRTILFGCPVYAWWQEVLELLEEKLTHCRLSSPKQIRLLALPDWSNASEWKLLLRTYVQSFQPEDPIHLILAASAEMMETVAAELTHFLTAELNISLEDIPDVTITNYPVSDEEFSNLYQSANAVIELPASNFIVPAHVRILNFDRLPDAIALLS